MSVEVLQTMSLIAYILAGVFFVLALVLFFRLKVPALWGEVSGRTARKAIQAMKWKGEDAQAAPKPAEAQPLLPERAPLVASEQKPPLKEAPGLGQTTPLQDVGQTDVLPRPSAVISPSEVGETAVLRAVAPYSTGELPRADETSLLTQKVKEEPRVFFEMEQELAFTDSTEIIE